MYSEKHCAQKIDKNNVLKSTMEKKLSDIFMFYMFISAHLATLPITRKLGGGARAKRGKSNRGSPPGF